MIHGRFQPFHNGHLEYLRGAAALSDPVFVGITNPDPRRVREEPSDPLRHLPESNPFTYTERLLMIEAVVAQLRRPQRRVREHVLGTYRLTAAERLEHGAAGKLVGPVAEHRPVGNLAGRRAPRPDGVDHATRSRPAESVQIRRPRRLDTRATAERFVRPIGDAVEEDDDDRVELHTGTRCNERTTCTTPGGTKASQSPPVRIASRTSRPEISFSAPSSRMTTS